MKRSSQALGFEHGRTNAETEIGINTECKRTSQNVTNQTAQDDGVSFARN